MSSPLDADDLALLADGFAAACQSATSASDLEARVNDVGWLDLLRTVGRPGFGAMFSAAATAGRLAGLVDDVVAAEFGLSVDHAVCIVHPAAHAATPPGRLEHDEVAVDGLVSTRFDPAGHVLVPLVAGDIVQLVSLDAGSLRIGRAGLDSTGSMRRLRGRAVPSRTGADAVPWTAAVGSARLALAHHLLANTRWMLEEARTHAINREQFGRPVASFQAVRHKLAETLAAIEGAEAIVNEAAATDDELATALAKSLAGRAALTTARHTQQILAGIGFTTDHPFQARMKLAITVDALYGSGRTIPTEIGRELSRRGGAPRLVEL